MNEKQFIEQHLSDWQWLNLFLSNPKPTLSQINTFPKRYRLLCTQLATAQANGFSYALINKLNDLAIRGHAKLYRQRRRFSTVISDYLSLDLPQTVRREWRWILLATLLFLLSIFIGMLSVWLNWGWMEAFSLHDKLTELYEPSAHARIGEAREGADDVTMWGYYIFNNTAISLKALAGGILAGLLTVYIVIFNGIMLGISFAFTASQNWLMPTFFPFIITHAAFELSALIFAAAVGFALASALLFPKRMSRKDNLQRRVKELFPLLPAVILFDIIAAAIEAFFSPRLLPIVIKLSVGITVWLLLIAYFLWMGRTRRATLN
ncbi:stage II sporulation protein M [Suttonella ornithocola]|uniref:Integral membrane protein DUF95 n=1 Tax=Suttonella ornithocola TaxID=279832 RepID=A0A380MW89_9GAMM|nr:stage II sporulation protein M [Suttonella ornithocola]SUO96444.1 Integral membrane protein DUF95 [Suttonella ornithocola]